MREEHEREHGQREHRGLRSDPDGEARQQGAGHHAAARKRPGHQRQGPHRGGESQHVAEGTERRKPEERRGRHDQGCPPREMVAPLEAPEEQQQGRNGGGAAERAPDREPARRRAVDARHAEHGGRRFRQRDVDRIAGRMRLMLGHVEVPDAEGEVDGVEVFERFGQEHEMRGQEDQHQRDAGRSVAPH